MICALLLTGFLTNSISDYLIARENVRRTIAESTLPLTSDNVYSEIQRDLLRPVFIASLMANDTFLRDWAIAGEQDASSVVRYLHEIKIEFGTVTSFFVSEQSHKYYYAHGLLKTVREDEPRDEWYFRVRDMEAPYEINVDPDLANRDEMTIFINYRAKDYAGNFIGATGVGLTVNKVNNLISSYEAKYARQIYFVDADGRMVLRPSNSPMLEYASLQEIGGLAGKVSGLLEGTTDSLTYQREGERRIMNCRYVPELDWHLIVEQSEEAMLAPLRHQLRINILSALLITAVVAGICILVIRGHTARIEKSHRELTDNAELIREQQKSLEEKAAQLEAANEKLQALNHEKDEFLGIVAHDLRSPLSAIIGLSELTQYELSPGNPAREAFADIQHSGKEMDQLIGELLNVSRIEAYHDSFQTEPVDWNRLIDRVAQRFAKEASDKRIQVDLKLSTTEGTTVNGVEEWMAVILGNLLSNAIKFSPEYTTVTVRTERRADKVLTCFEDAGPGIKAEEQDKLFHKFARLSARPTGKENSTGLGLYIVKKMCDRLGIGIHVESEFGKGSAFILEQKI